MFVGFAVTLVLARLLTPADYGVVALLSIFIQLAGVFSDIGFGDALVQKKEATELDFNSVFYMSVALSLICYAILFFLAPAIAAFYNNPELTSIMRVLSLTVVFNSINSVQGAELKRGLLFNLGFKISMISLFVNAIIGVSLALKGYGPWAIVWSQTCSSFVGVVAYWFIIRWRPKLMFSFTAVRGMLQFSWKVVCVSLIDKVYSNLYGLIIGKMYTPADLALVNKGRSLPSLFMDAINGTINAVAFPAMAQIQDDIGKVRMGMRKMLMCSTFLVFPLMAGLAACADSIVYLMFGENWVPCVPYVMVFCFSFAIYPFQTINLFTVLALGHSDSFLKVEIVKKVFGLILIALSIRHGVMAFLVATCFISDPIALYVNSRPAKRFIGYSLRQQAVDMLPAATCALVMGGLVYVLGLVCRMVLASVANGFIAMFLTAALQCILGVSVYFSLAYAFRLRALDEYLTVLRPRFGHYRLYRALDSRFAR